tara:strand:+ start:2169 stop:2672 length:504 start_codon:yes stop_codon:yes gene_type:complete
MIKITTILVLILAFNSAVYSYELEARVTRLDYNVGKYADFDVNLYQVGVSKFYGNTGWSVMTGQSDKDTDKGLAGEVKNFWVMSVTQRFRLSNRFTLGTSLNYTEYKSVIDGRGNPDTDPGYGVSLISRLSQDLFIKLSYDDFYHKFNKSVGLETTRGAGLSIIYPF